MASQEVRHTDEPLVRIGSEKPTPFYSFIKADWKLPWLLATAVSSALFIVIGSVVGLWWAGWVYMVFALTLYGTFIEIRIPGLKLPLITWLYRKGSHWCRGIMGHNWYLSLDPEIGEAFGMTNAQRDPPRPVKALGKIRFKPHEVATLAKDGIQRAILGMAEDFRQHTLSGTLRVTSESLYGVDSGVRDRRLAAYAHLLDTLSQSDVYRFAWQDTTLLGEHHDPTSLLEVIQQNQHVKRLSPPNRDVLLRWIAENNRKSDVHETTMTLSVYLPAVRHEAKQLGGDFGKVLERVLRDFYSSIIGRGSGQSPIGLTSARFLSYNDLILLNLLRLDPVFAQALWQQWSRPDDTDYLLNEKLAWADWGSFSSKEICQLGETHHLGFYVEEFGEAGMEQDAFWEVVNVPVPKTVTVIFQMIPRARSQKSVERYTTAVKGVNIDRTKELKRVTEAHAEAEREALEIEREVARSKGQVGKVRCYIDVTGETPEQALAYARILRSAVTTNTPFVIRPLKDRQLRGIDAVMPLTRGLRI